MRNRSSILSFLVRCIRVIVTSVILLRICLATACAEPPRVDAARKAHEAPIRQLFKDVNLEYPPGALFLRVFKYEGELELWASGKGDTAYTYVKDYPITWWRMPGELGPKREQGDYQVPEGYYKITVFNPNSDYHLSLGINYPNQSDAIRKHGSDAGGDIFIHGSTATIGCIPIGNEAIEELYLIALDTRGHSKKEIPVHIFPCRMNEGRCAALLDSLGKDDEELRLFWSEIREGFFFFEEKSIPPRTGIYRDGRNIVIHGK